MAPSAPWLSPVPLPPTHTSGAPNRFQAGSSASTGVKVKNIAPDYRPDPASPLSRATNSYSGHPDRLVASQDSDSPIDAKERRRDRNKGKTVPPQEVEMSRKTAEEGTIQRLLDCGPKILFIYLDNALARQFYDAVPDKERVTLFPVNVKKSMIKWAATIDEYQEIDRLVYIVHRRATGGLPELSRVAQALRNKTELAHGGGLSLNDAKAPRAGETDQEFSENDTNTSRAEEVSQEPSKSNGSNPQAEQEPSGNDADTPQAQQEPSGNDNNTPRADEVDQGPSGAHTDTGLAAANGSLDDHHGHIIPDREDSNGTEALGEPSTPPLPGPEEVTSHAPSVSLRPATPPLFEENRRPADYLKLPTVASHAKLFVASFSLISATFGGVCAWTLLAYELPDVTLWIRLLLIPVKLGLVCAIFMAVRRALHLARGIAVVVRAVKPVTGALALCVTRTIAWTFQQVLKLAISLLRCLHDRAAAFTDAGPQ